MAKVIIVIGDTGTGKSTSIRTLDPKETYIINVLGKDLPFRGSSTLYNAENKNLSVVSDYGSIVNVLQGISTKLPAVKQIVLDDLGFVMTEEFFRRASEKGYEKFSEMGSHMQQIISTAKSLRDDLTVILVFHEDDDVSDRIKISKKVKLIGMMLEDKYNPLAIVSVCLFTDVVFDKDGQANYGFITQRTQVKGQIIPAKSPDGMFDKNRIPNDLSLVIKEINNYYKKPAPVSA